MDCKKFNILIKGKTKKRKSRLKGRKKPDDGAKYWPENQRTYENQQQNLKRGDQFFQS